MIKRYIHKKFDEKALPYPTIGNVPNIKTVDGNFDKNAMTRRQKVELIITDIAGKAENRSEKPIDYKLAHGIFICFDTTDKTSLENV